MVFNTFILCWKPGSLRTSARETHRHQWGATYLLRLPDMLPEMPKHIPHDAIFYASSTHRRGVRGRDLLLRILLDLSASATLYFVRERKYIPRSSCGRMFSHDQYRERAPAFWTPCPMRWVSCFGLPLVLASYCVAGCGVALFLRVER